MERTYSFCGVNEDELPSSDNPIECMDFRAVPKGYLQGFANLWVSKMGLEIYGCSVYMKDGKLHMR